ncbi:hypothetical protein OG264_11640 [Streptomyces xanthophaeus]|uniref:hypothetical protein n=1 Tax=Streptomyces xanthophaeus TaxID=67385 RepID=UPI00386EC4F4|nr:hypothetical protein OG264_11640 [Streptomyces xanthophaeus]
MDETYWLSQESEELEAQLDPSMWPTYYGAAREQYVITYKNNRGHVEMRKYGDVLIASRDYASQQDTLLPGESVEMHRYMRTRVAVSRRRPEAT